MCANPLIKLKSFKGIDLDIRDGEFLTLVGASGSGKSTLLRIISGLEEQTFGSIRIKDEEVSRKPPKDRLQGHLGLQLRRVGVTFLLRHLWFLRNRPRHILNQCLDFGVHYKNGDGAPVPINEPAGLP
ncbi:ATP-binding cassette domain-containing protein [Halomonas piscis]|uniref:ATP-binding cassette domain-containing protein n=1 Tax=Halomonas piscis TaxID=3031727 RepID=UPI0038996283